MDLMATMSKLLSFFDILHYIPGFRFYIPFFPISVQTFVLAITQMNSTTSSKVVAEYCSAEEVSTEELCIDDMNEVIHRLGIAGKETDDHRAGIGNVDVSELTDIFLDQEPTPQEIKQVFEVFDVNGDGFIDATELQRVLCGLCMKEGAELEQCGRMISAFDANGDGLLDFEEFVSVMEKCFS